MQLLVTLIHTLRLTLIYVLKIASVSSLSSYCEVSKHFAFSFLVPLHAHVKECIDCDFHSTVYIEQ